MKKKILLTIIMILTILLMYVITLKFKVVDFTFAWILNFMLMFCVSMFTETLKSKHLSEYYLEKRWENRGKIYEKFGINFYRKLLVLVGWEKLNKKANPVNGNLETLINLEYKTKQSELGHLIIFLIVNGFTIYVIIKFTFIKSLWLIFLNVILNVYPIFLQRYNRPRLKKALELNKCRQRRLHNRHFELAGT
jgi:hypothetical protein